MSRNRKLVPESKKALDQMKYEIAAELGLMTGGHSMGDVHSEFGSELGTTSSSSVSWGDMASRDVGVVGGTITARLIRKAEDALLSL